MARQSSLSSLRLLVAVLTICSAVFLDNAFADGRTEWGVMAYLSGQDDLEPDAQVYLDTIMQAARHGQCAAVVQIDGAGQCVRWLRQAGGRRERQRLGTVNMGARSTLASFVAWGWEKLEADRYLLIVLGHGTGLATLAPALSGVAFDGGSSDALTLAELIGGLAESRPDDRRFDLVSLEACYAASLEVAYGLRPVADYMVASPDRVPTPGLPWATTLEELSGHVDAPALIEALCSRYSHALVGTDVAATGEVADALAGLAQALNVNLSTNARFVRLVRSRTRSWGYRSEMCDLLHFAGLLHQMAPDDLVERRAAELVRSLETAIIGTSEQETANAEVHPGNLGLFFPSGWEDVPAHYGRDYAMADKTGWADFLHAYYEASGRPLRASEVRLPGTRCHRRLIQISSMLPPHCEAQTPWRFTMGRRKPIEAPQSPCE